MKAQLIIFILFCLILAACEKDVSNVTPQPIDTTVNLVGTWHVDSATYFSMNLEKCICPEYFYGSFNTDDSIKFYDAVKKDLVFRKCTRIRGDNIFYHFDSVNVSFIKDSMLWIPLPGWDGCFGSPINWKQISSEKGFFTTFNLYRDWTDTYFNQDTLTFKISRTSNGNKNILLTIDPFIEYTSFFEWDGDYESSLDGYCVKIYLSRIK
jgi:hypothetical protein